MITYAELIDIIAGYSSGWPGTNPYDLAHDLLPPVRRGWPAGTLLRRHHDELTSHDVNRR